MIPVKCDPQRTLLRVSLDEIEEFQGNLKSLGTREYEKLRQSIVEKGFIAPLFVWRNGSTRWKLLDGHQRVRLLRQEGWTPEGGLPVVPIEADDEKDAKEKLLAIVGRYGRIDGQGLYEFVSEVGIDLEDWQVPDLPDIDMEAWLNDFVRDLPTGTEYGEDATDGLTLKAKFMVTAPQESFQVILEKLQVIQGEIPEMEIKTDLTT